MNSIVLYLGISFYVPQPTDTGQNNTRILIDIAAHNESPVIPMPKAIQQPTLEL
jgi:hypothetical protein